MHKISARVSQDSPWTFDTFVLRISDRNSTLLLDKIEEHEEHKDETTNKRTETTQEHKNEPHCLGRQFCRARVVVETNLKWNNSNKHRFTRWFSDRKSSQQHTNGSWTTTTDFTNLRAQKLRYQRMWSDPRVWGLNDSTWLEDLALEFELDS